MPKRRLKTKGWPPERRAAQRARLHASRIWMRSTGPRTAEGKARSCLNAQKYPGDRVWTQQIRHYLRLQNLYLKVLKMTLAQRVEPWCHKAQFPAVLAAGKRVKNLPFLLGFLGEILLVSGIQILRENNG